MEKSFFEKLKKGMDIEKSPDKKSVIERKKKAKKEVIGKKKKIKVHMVKSSSEIDAKQFNQTKKESTSKESTSVPSSETTIVNEEKPPTIEGKKWFEPEGQLTVDVYQTDKEIVIQSAIAGIEPDDLDIIIENDMVAIRGNRKKLFEEKKINYFYQECYWGQFSREIILPEEVDNSRAQATMKKGILTIRIPKIESKNKRKINVRE